MARPKITAAFASFTEVDAGEHRAYNAWHQLDHLPEQLTIPGVGWGERWVASPRHRAGRRARPPLHRAQYATVYLMAEPVDETMADFRALARTLADDGRFHRHRRSVANGLFDVALTAAAPRVAVSGEAVPYRPATGVHVRVDEVADAAAVEDLIGWTASRRLPSLLALDGVAGTWVLRPSSLDPGSGDAHARRVLTITWLDGPVADVGGAVAGAPEPDGALAAVAFDSVLDRIEPHRWDWFDDEERR